MQLQQVAMNLIVNSIEAMKDVDGIRELAHQVTARLKTSRFSFRSVIPAWDFRRNWRNRYSTRSLQPNPTAPAWGFASAGQSLSLMVGACGGSVRLGSGATFHLSLPAAPIALG